MKNNKKGKLNEEAALRALLRKEIVRILEADKESEEKPQKEPQEEPQEEPEKEEGLPQDLDAATSLYIRKLKDSADGVQDDDLVEMVSNIVSAFTSSSEHRLSILKAVKSNIVR